MLRNTFIIFLLSGFWHGANWTFICWGLLNAIYFVPLLLLGKNRNNMETVAQGKMFPTIKELLQMLFTFLLTVFAWIFFRSENMAMALSYIQKLCSISILKMPEILPKQTILFLFFFLLIEWIGREQQYAIEKFGFGWHRIFRWTFYLLLFMCICLFNGEDQPFIYFQF